MTPIPTTLDVAMLRHRQSRSMKTIARLSARIPEALAEKVKIRAVREKRTVQDLLIDALELYLRTPLKKEGKS